MPTRTVKTLHDRLYVKLESDRENPGEVRYVVVASLAEMTDGWEEGDQVGRYELRETGTLHVTRALK